MGNEKETLNFIYELGMLKRIKREGWRIAGIENPESVADHSLRAAQIAYLLAKLEGYKSPHELATMLIFHDIGECRIGDLHKIAQRYVKADEKGVVKAQTGKLGEAGKEIFSLWNAVEGSSSQAGIIAKDSDYLEVIITAKEYLKLGYPAAQDWIENAGKKLRTKSAKKLFSALASSSPDSWWAGLKKM